MADYKLRYYIPTLSSKLAEVINNRSHWRNRNVNNPIAKSLDLLHTELQHELEQFPDNMFPEIDKLVVGKFDSATYRETNEFLTTLSGYYNIKRTKANNEREALVSQMTDTPEKAAQFQEMRVRYQNEAVMNLVQHTSDPVRIVEWNGELIQKIYPIYDDEQRPDGPLDFRSEFYSPVKQMFGTKFDTLYFNIGVIWFMTIVLYVTLYFDALGRLVNSVEMWKKYRRKFVKFES
jgi:hypothetical protein